MEFTMEFLLEQGVYAKNHADKITFPTIVRLSFLLCSLAFVD